jgi:hypothetical protein
MPFSRGKANPGGGENGAPEMTISTLDRKRLWGKAANRCVVCREPLTRPEDAGSPEVVIGEEAHIVGEKPGAARHETLEPNVRDGYANRILLCPTHHTLVDKQEDAWPVERLRQAKTDHENLMHERTADPSKARIVLPPEVVLSWIVGGGALLQLMEGAHGFIYEIDESLTSTRREAATSLVSTAVDLGELAPEFSIEEREEAINLLSELWRAARSADLAVLGARADAEYREGHWPLHWPTAILRVLDAASVASSLQPSAD